MSKLGLTSPSTKGKQQLELLYCTLVSAGPVVAQALEVSCTPEKDGKFGRVVGFTLAEPNL